MRRALDPGRLRHEVKLQAVATTSDGAGGFTESWGDLANLFAQIEPVRAASTFGADQSIERVTHRITLRFRADVSSGMRLVKGSRVFELVTVHDPDESGRYLVCTAREAGR